MVDKQLFLSATTNDSSSISNKRLNEINLGCNIASNSVFSTLYTASGQQRNKLNGISKLRKSSRKFGDFSNRKCIAPSGQF